MTALAHSGRPRSVGGSASGLRADAPTFVSRLAPAPAVAAVTAAAPPLACLGTPLCRELGLLPAPADGATAPAAALPASPQAAVDGATLAALRALWAASPSALANRWPRTGAGAGAGQAGDGHAAERQGGEADRPSPGRVQAAAVLPTAPRPAQPQPARADAAVDAPAGTAALALHEVVWPASLSPSPDRSPPASPRRSPPRPRARSELARRAIAAALGTRPEGQAPAPPRPHGAPPTGALPPPRADVRALPTAPRPRPCPPAAAGSWRTPAPVVSPRTLAVRPAVAGRGPARAPAAVPVRPPGGGRGAAGAPTAVPVRAGVPPRVAPQVEAAEPAPGRDGRRAVAVAVVQTARPAADPAPHTEAPTRR